MFTQVWHWFRTENLLLKIIRPTPKNMAWEKASNLRQLIEYGRQSEARNFEMAQDIDK